MGSDDALTLADVIEATFLVANDDKVSGVTSSATDIKPRKPDETRMMPVWGSTVSTRPRASPGASTTSHAAGLRAATLFPSIGSSSPGSLGGRVARAR